MDDLALGFAVVCAAAVGVSCGLAGDTNAAFIFAGVLALLWLRLKTRA